ncbi:hypothetical protein FHX40_2095 [Thermopolyspora flexuosa]|uniref:Uncharacterized protein n=1 Tax=Thermopolyspora flexuosa TaxID=103836 RepID=A0A543IXT4_9ACTN|nr:hypothetical protein FHX40_2095 [Thermopolyspora flexuosa]
MTHCRHGLVRPAARPDDGPRAGRTREPGEEGR